MSDLINFEALIIQGVNLAIVVFVLYRFVFKPYLSILDEEEKKAREIEELHASSELLQKKAEEDAEATRAEAKETAKKIREESKSLAKQEASGILEHANQEADTLRAKGMSDIENERRALEAELQKKVVSVALKLNEKLFGKGEANREFVENIASK